MKKQNRQAGRISLWDLLILILAGMLGYLVYIRGHADKYLPDQYKSTTVLGTPGTVAPPALPIAASTPVPAKPKAIEASGNPVAEEPAAETSSPELAENPAPEPVPAVSGESKPPAEGANAAAPVVLSKLERRFWPQQVKLLQATEFPVVFDGKEVGSASAPAGMAVKLLEIRGEKLLVQNGQAVIEIPADQTDIMERVTVIAELSGNEQPPAPAPTAAPWNPHAHTPR